MKGVTGLKSPPPFNLRMEGTGNASRVGGDGVFFPKRRKLRKPRKTQHGQEEKTNANVSSSIEKRYAHV